MEWFQTVMEADRNLFLYLNGFHTPYWDNVMVMVSRMIDWLPFYFTAIYLIFKAFRTKGFLVLASLAILLLLCFTFSYWMKNSFQRLRPNYDPGLEGLVHSIGNVGLYGFISSHACNVFAVFTFSTFIFSSRIYCLSLLVWCALVSYSRIYLGVHFPLDILAGGVTGSLVGWLIYSFMIRIEKLCYTKKPPAIAEYRLGHGDALGVMAVFGAMVLLFMGISLIESNLSP